MAKPLFAPVYPFIAVLLVCYIRDIILSHIVWSAAHDVVLLVLLAHNKHFYSETTIIVGPRPFIYIIIILQQMCCPYGSPTIR